MKFKYYLRGCGLGILFAAIVLMIAFHTQNKTMDDTAVMERASELGMIMPETQNTDTEADTQQGEPVSKTEPELTTETSATSTQITDDGNTIPADKQKNIKKNTDKKESDKKESDKKELDKKESDKKTDADKAEESEDITVKIKSGEVCRQLAEELEDLGLVEDAESFRKYMQQCGYDNQIGVGTFHLKRGMTQEEIAKVFITK